MRNEVLIELNKRIQDLQKVAKPGEIDTGMSGSFVRFNYYIQSHTAMTEDEFSSCVYDDWLRKQHKRIYEEINSKPW